MAVRKFAVSFESELAAQVRLAAESEGASVSAWLADAAARRLKLKALGEAVAAYEADSGPITDEERDEARRIWPD